MRGLFGAFAENWLEATGEVLVGDGYLPALEPRDDGGPMMVVRSSAGVGDTEHRGAATTSRSRRRASRSTSRRRTSSPRPAFIEALQDAAERGVRRAGPRARARTSTSRRSGWPAAPPTTSCSRPASRSTSTSRRCCTRRRMTVDGCWSAVGSVNFDNRSFQLNDEATLCVTSDAFAGLLTEQFERDLERLGADRARALERSRAACSARGRRRSSSPGASSRSAAARVRGSHAQGHRGLELAAGGRPRRQPARVRRARAARRDAVGLRVRLVGWRVPFLLSAALIGVGLWIRLGISESPLFRELARKGEREDAPLARVVTCYPRQLAIAIAARFGVDVASTRSRCSSSRTRRRSSASPRPWRSTPCSSAPRSSSC